MSCKCQSCGELYQVDFIVSDKIWQKIRPNKKEPRTFADGGLLCGKCIVEELEKMGYGGYYLFNTKDVAKKLIERGDFFKTPATPTKED